MNGNKVYFRTHVRLKHLKDQPYLKYTDNRFVKGLLRKLNNNVDINDEQVARVKVLYESYVTYGDRR